MNPTPIAAPFPVESFLKPSAQEQSNIALASCQPASEAPCCIPVRVGLFFDGTNNNLERDLKGRRIGLPDPKTKEVKSLPNKPLKPEECSHSNVVRLFHTYPEDKREQGYYRYYIPGVGTEFKDIRELTESSDGKAFAKGGQPRIVWGLFQVLNAIHSTLHDGEKLLYTTDQAGQLAQAYDKEVGRTEQSGNGKGPNSVMTHKKWFAPHLEKLAAALKTKPKPSIPSLTVYVFGFSRGSAEAAAFCHYFNDLLEGGKLVGITATIAFVGLFDLVASVGGSASIAQTTAAPDAWFDGHWAWAERTLDPLPGCVAAGVHYIAAHELRMNFPVTTQGKLKEYYFPGVHSDVGGGYAPGEQGKSRGKQAALLSQIPLLHMYKAAREAGVPLKPFSELELTVQDDFAVDAELASAWEAYTSELGDDGAVLKKHMQLYYRWRAMRLKTLETTVSFTSASAQDQQDLRDANRMLAGDLEALRVRRKGRPLGSAKDQQKPFWYKDMERINQWHYYRAQNGLALDDWEQWALGIFESPEPLPDDVARFFDNYLHDSYAGFYLAGEVTEYDKRVKVAKIMAEKPEKLEGFDKKIYNITRKTKIAQAKQEAHEPMSDEEVHLVKEAEYGTPYPIMTDADSADMRDPVITTQTATRREGGGYILRRGYYPHTGFFFRRPVNEDELRRAPVAYKQRKKTGKDVPVEMVWSDNLRVDIARAKTVEQADTAIS